MLTIQKLDEYFGVTNVLSRMKSLELILAGVP